MNEFFCCFARLSTRADSSERKFFWARMPAPPNILCPYAYVRRMFCSKHGFVRIIILLFNTSIAQVNILKYDQMRNQFKCFNQFKVYK